MDRRVFFPLLAKWVLYVTIACITLILQMVPTMELRFWLPVPDIMAVVTLVWALRHPDSVPAILVVAMALLADFLLARPLGIAPFLLLLMSEFVRNRSRDLRKMQLLPEWATASAALLVLIIAERMIYVMTFIQPPPLSYSLLLFLMNALIYPVVVFVSWAAFGIRKTAIGEIDDLGQVL